MSRGLWKVFCLCCIAGPVAADELVFTNGDRLTGELLSASDGQLRFRSAVLGDISVGIAKVGTLGTEAPVEIHMADGTVVLDRAVQGDPGQLVTAGTSRVGPQSFPLAELAAINPPPVAWHGELTAGAEFERGNSISDEGNFSLKARRESEENRIRFELDYEGERVTDRETGLSTTNERKLEADLKYDHFLSERVYWFARSRATKDGVNDLDLRFGAGGGFGYRWVRTPRTTFDVELGLNWISENYELSENDEEYLGGIFTWDFDHRLTDRISFFSDLDWLVDLEDWDDRFNVDAEFGIRNQINSSFFLEFKVDWEYNAEPATGAERQDTDYIFGLGYRF